MKQKEYLLSSLMIAFVAGFIYYAFADPDIIKKIPTLAYQTILSVTDTRETALDNKEYGLKTTKLTEPSEYPGSVTVRVPSYISSLAELGINIPDFSNFIRVRDFGGGIISFNDNNSGVREHPGDFGFDMHFGDDMTEYAGYYDIAPLDSIERRVRIKIHNMDSLNITLNDMMSKLNESIEKMTEQFKSEEFTKNFKNFDGKEFEINIDADELKSEIDESMKDFDEDMKEFKYDMKEFQDSMKKLNEEMKDLKESMKNIDSVKYNKRFKIKIDTIET
jgi:hypothetical protein